MTGIIGRPVVLTLNTTGLPITGPPITLFQQGQETIAIRGLALTFVYNPSLGISKYFEHMEK